MFQQPPGPPFLPPPPPLRGSDHSLGLPPHPPRTFQPAGGFNVPSPAPFFANNASNFHIPAQTSSFNWRSRGNAPSSGNLFTSQTATTTRQREGETKTVYDTAKEQIDDSIYELPDHVELELADGSIDNLWVEANDLLEAGNTTHQEEEDVVLEQTNEDNFNNINNTFLEGTVHKSVYFLYGGKSQHFVCAVEFLSTTQIIENL